MLTILEADEEGLFKIFDTITKNLTPIKLATF